MNDNHDHDKILDWGDEVPYVGFLVNDFAEDGDTIAVCSEHDLDCVADHGPPTRWWLLANAARDQLCYRRMLMNGFELVDKADLEDTFFSDMLGPYIEKVDIVIRLAIDVDLDGLHAFEDELFGPGGPPSGFLYSALGPFPLVEDHFPGLEEPEGEEPSPS